MTAVIAATDNLFDYFHEAVEGARAQQGLRIGDDTALYLANLLADRARADRPAPTETTLAELHGRAANAPPAEQVRAYRELGDRALYSLGYFEESLERRVVGSTYYQDMGRAAYTRVDHVMKRWYANAFNAVFEELADEFRGCMALLTAVRDTHLREHPEEVLSLYERWAKSGSDALARRLRVAGVVVPGGEAEG